MSEEDEVFEDEIDPRIKGELDILNQSTDEINKLETELIEHREKFKSSLASATQQLQKLTKKYGKSIERARPYFITKAEVAQAQLALQRAVHNFQRANGVHRAAKETIALAESRLSEFEDKKVDMAWQEMLNLQTIRFMEAERDRTKSADLHERATKKFEFLEKKMQAQRKKHKNSTTKTKPYFELKEFLEVDLQKKRQKVEELQRKVDAAKKRYKTSLENLEQISSEIHEKRRKHRALEAINARKVDEAENDTHDSNNRLLSNPLELDLVGKNTYDDIEELEAELDDFNLDDDEDYYDEDELSSGSDSEAESIDSTPKVKRKNHQLKRANTAPGLRINKPIVKRKAFKHRPVSLQRATSVNVSSPSYGSKLLNEPDEEDDNCFQPIKEDANDEKSLFNDAEEQEEATYRRLHGTNIDQDTDPQPTVQKAKKHLSAPEDFDIFDELC